ncbi:hypothetical protein ACE6H2_009661 [Prunus campanulata]
MTLAYIYCERNIVYMMGSYKNYSLNLTTWSLAFNFFPYTYTTLLHERMPVSAGLVGFNCCVGYLLLALECQLYFFT